MALSEEHMSKTAVDELPLSRKTRRQLAAAAKSVGRTKEEIAAALLEATLEADAQEAKLTEQAIAEADAGGPFATNEEVQAWLKSWGTDDELPAPQALIRL